MHQGDATTELTSGISRRSFVQGAAWSVPVVASAVTMPQASASVASPFTISWGPVTPFSTLRYDDDTFVPVERMGNSLAYSALLVVASEPNASDLTVEFVTGASASGHTNHLGEFASGVGVWNLGPHPRVEWLEGDRTIRSLPVTSRFLIPANTLRSGDNMLPIAWKLTPTAIAYPGPFGRTGYDFRTTVTYEGQTVFSSYAQGNLTDSTEPVQLEANDIHG
ncbi:hypothetical protein [Microbacterium sp. NPDC058345]|uniref:hypothetical protein n=1 Tax=Microbacterium sp. NPDC058345 TaxID=3346455 RepID=UPI00365DA214